MPDLPEDHTAPCYDGELDHFHLLVLRIGGLLSRQRNHAAVGRHAGNIHLSQAPAGRKLHFWLVPLAAPAAPPEIPAETLLDGINIGAAAL